MNVTGAGRGALCALLATLLAAPAFAAPEGGREDAPLAPAAAAEFVTGGISKEDADYLRARAASYSLEIVFATTTGAGTAFAADVALTVRDEQGRTVRSLPSAEPIVLARLAPGRYTIEAVYEGRVRSSQVDVGRGHQKVGLTW